MADVAPLSEDDNASIVEMAADSCGIKAAPLDSAVGTKVDAGDLISWPALGDTTDKGKVRLPEALHQVRPLSLVAVGNYSRPEQKYARRLLRRTMIAMVVRTTGPRPLAIKPPTRSQLQRTIIALVCKASQI